MASAFMPTLSLEECTDLKSENAPQSTNNKWNEARQCATNRPKYSWKPACHASPEAPLDPKHNFVMQGVKGNRCLFRLRLPSETAPPAPGQTALLAPGCALRAALLQVARCPCR